MPDLTRVRRPAVIERFVGLGATAMPSLEALGAAADIVSGVVVDDAQVRDVIGNGEDEALLAVMAAGSIVAIHGTVSPRVCRALGALAAGKGVAGLGQSSPSTMGGQK